MYIIETFIFFALFHTSFGVPAYGSNAPPGCSDDQLRMCADNAEPVLRSADFVVPDNSRSLNQVCRIWTELTNCIGNYTKRCLTPNKRPEFVQNTNDPLIAMTNFCRNPAQQNEYLSHAPCVKKISTQDNYCGKQYKFFVDLVDEGTIKQICCAKAKFMNCFMTRTPSGCDSGRTDGGKNSTKLAVAMLDSSLAFMSHRCEASRFKESDCPGISSSRENNKGPLANSGVLQTAASGGFGSQFQLDQGNKQQGGWIQPGGSVGVRPTTSTKEIKQRPDQFAGSQQQQKQRPQTRPGPGGPGQGGGGTISSLKQIYLLLACVALLQISLYTTQYD